ncbi:hypothetical protein MMC13_003542 [Lambiella insularis]|nr:hypothetical protein [Lambiella insularis]
MVEGMPPHITVQSPGGNSSAGLPAQSPIAPDGATAAKDVKYKPSLSAEPRQTPNGLGFPGKLIRTLSSGNGTPNVSATISEGRRNSQTAMDPLSQHILERNHRDNTLNQRTRTGTASEAGLEASDTSPSIAPTRTPADATVTRLDISASSGKDKRKGGSFLSRFIGSKKKDASTDVLDDESEFGDKRAEGTDADVFLQPIGFIPRFPAPPKYIRIRSRGKKEKDFNRVFLAQELRGRTGVEIAQAGGRSVKRGLVNPAEKTKSGKAIWAMEFSKDGKFLAAGGHDHIVRVWGVIANEDDRLTLEKEEAGQSTGGGGGGARLSAPVFKTKPVHEYEGHTASVLDLSWSKNNFLLSSSMDKTVRLWHTSRRECLCCFKHNDFVTSIQFHPRDDRFFLAGSLDSKLRLWSIPDKSVAFWTQLTDIITAVAFAPDGKTAIVGCLSGICNFYETEGLSFQTQMHVRSAHGRNAKGSKVTGIQSMTYPPGDPSGEVKLVVTTNDSRVRVYNLRDKGLELKLKGNENKNSQIKGSLSDDGRFVICGSEDKKVYIWSTGPTEKDKDKRPVEMFEAHSAIVTSAIMAPTATRQLLQLSGDPLYELCNPPPVTLFSRSESHSSQPPTENGHNLEGSVPPTPMTAESTLRPAKPEESPAFIARSAHTDGNIIVTADYMGRIKVFRQDCAYRKRHRTDNWETSSTISKKMLNRSSSIATRNSISRRDSLSHPSSDRIISWRQTIERSNGSHEQINGQSAYRSGFHRSISPQKSFGNPSPRLPGQPIMATVNTPSMSISTTSNPPSLHKASLDSSNLASQSSPIVDQQSDPLMLQGTQSNMFWNTATYAEQESNHVQRTRTRNNDETSPVAGSGREAHSENTESANGLLRPGFDGQGDRKGSTFSGLSIGTRASLLSSEFSSDGAAGELEEEVRCKRCGGESFKARVMSGGEKKLVCTECGLLG